MADSARALRNTVWTAVIEEVLKLEAVKNANQVVRSVWELLMKTALDVLLFMFAAAAFSEFVGETNQLGLPLLCFFFYSH